MSISMITLISFYNYDDTLFDNLVLPSEMDREAFIFLLLQRFGEFEVTYTDFDFLKNSIGYWSRSNQETFKRLYETISAQYNPIENYDRYEEIEDINVSNSKINSIGNSLDKVSGYDSEQMENASSNKNDSLTDSNSNGTNTHNAHIHGNIGITTSSQMQSEVLSLYKKENIYMMICELFASEYLILVY